MTLIEREFVLENYHLINVVFPVEYWPTNITSGLESKSGSLK